jgi:hypothetical protein
MISSTPIAERTVDLIKVTGERVTLRVEFGSIRAQGKDFRCPVRFFGWGNPPPDICGYDSLQAFVLSVGLVHSILDTFVRGGGRVVWSGTDTGYDLDLFVFSPEKGST